MPEELNRLITDQLADLLFTPSPDANDNLRREGVPPEKIFLVGNAMIDTLVRLLPRAEERWHQLRRDFIGTRAAEHFVLVTLHRPSNVDDRSRLQKTVQALQEIARTVPVIFPVHPRTRQQLQGLTDRGHAAQIAFLEPLSYLDFLALQRHARLVITDSGGVQEETTFLRVPCLTLRENTERPITVREGTNILIGRDTHRLRQEVDRILAHGTPSRAIPDLWDGKAGERIASIVAQAAQLRPAREREE
jgi:UDP-N-acetylglucosamine 2-epimerase (non-hydrolysing)